MLYEAVVTMVGVSFLLLLLVYQGAAATAGTEYWEYAVIGAGPGGLQMGYYLQKADRNFIIMEKNNISGSFFAKYPRHGKLISINKRHTGKTNKEFNMRHDWNSLLSDNEDMLMRHYSRDFFPKSDTLVNYLNDYSKTFDLNVKYNTQIWNISREWNSTQNSSLYRMNDQHGNTYHCKYLIVATGMGKPNIPKYSFMNLADGYEDMSVNPLDYEGKNVLIMGHGNAAFETADAIYGHASVVHMVSRSRLRLAWSTHYVGDVRGVNNGLLDTYQLKSLDGLLEGSVSEKIVSVKKDNSTGKVHIELVKSLDKDNFALRDSYDHIIRCLGFNFDDSMFQSHTQPIRGVSRLDKFPLIDDDFQVVERPNMYVAGTAAHSLDYRRAAGGFIHGFRYNVRALHHILENRNHRVRWPSVSYPITSLLSVLVKRMNEADGMYQMFGQLGDIILLKSNETFELLEDFPVNMLAQFESVSGHPAGPMIVMIMQYGQNFSGPNADVFREDRAVGNADVAHKSNFLHPTLYYYPVLPTDEEMDSRSKVWPLPIPKRIHHVVEDFLTDFTGATSHILPLRRFLQFCTDIELRQFTADECLEVALTHTTLPYSCRQHFLQGQGVVLNPELQKAMETLDLDEQSTVAMDSELS